MTDKKYKWDHPLAWLLETAENWDHNQLKAEFQMVVSTLDFDTLQDMYESDMDKDGYFNPIE